MKETNISSLIDRYPALLLDAYGVLLDERGPLPGARSLIERLNEQGKDYFVLTNSASRLPEGMARDLQRMGLAISAERLITSGQLLEKYFREKELVGRSCFVLGTEDSKAYVRLAGGRVIPLNTRNEAEVIVLADQAGFPVFDALDDALSFLLGSVDRGQPPHLLLCNPDLIYPRASGRFGFTAGALATMFEAVLRERHAGEEVEFVRLGKPHAPMFEEAVRRAGTREMVMVGDQLATDILGAQTSGMHSALLDERLARVESDGWPQEIAPNYLLASLELDPSST